MRDNCGRRGRHKAWPFLAMMAANSGRGWGGFGPDGPFGPAGPFGPSGPFGPGGPFGSGGPKGGGRRRGRMFGSGELRLVLLRLIADEPRHGYELIKAIEEMTGGAYAPSPGTIYPTLALLEDEGVIATAAGDEARKAYAVTDSGKTELDERAEEVEALLERLSGHGERAESMASSDIFRAAGNLAAVVRNRAREGNFDEETRRKVVDLVDELAKKIERL